MYCYTWTQFASSLKTYFNNEREQNTHKTKLITACELEIKIMMEKYIINKNNVLMTYGLGDYKSDCFVYQDSQLLTIIKVWIDDAIRFSPTKYRIILFSASIYLQFLFSHKWFAASSMDQFYNLYDSAKPDKIRKF